MFKIVIAKGLRFSRLSQAVPNEGSLAVCEPPVRFKPRTHRLRWWRINFPLQVLGNSNQCVVPLRKELKTDWLGKACKQKGTFTDKWLAERAKVSQVTIG